MAADIQFIKGINEPSIPDVNLTRSRDGTNGTATFVFRTPSIFEASSELGDITGTSLTSCTVPLTLTYKRPCGTSIMSMLFIARPVMGRMGG